jgi:DNA gyrase subunit A
LSEDNDDKRDDGPQPGGDIKPIAITDEMRRAISITR